MKKGDLKKQEILQTAEQLFCKKGYEQTSIQDILDVLSASKGSFYHHYPSKESLLEAMCVMRANESVQDTLNALNKTYHGEIEAIGRILAGLMPFRNDRLTFLLMLLPVLHVPEGRSVKTCYCEALKDAFLPVLTEHLKAAIREEAVFCLWPEQTASICIELMNSLWFSLCEAIIKNEENDMIADASDLLVLLNANRTAVEKILSAPFGSIPILDLPGLKSLCELIHIHWKNHQ